MSERPDQPDMVEGGVPIEGVPMEVEPNRFFEKTNLHYIFVSARCFFRDQKSVK